MGQNRRVSCRPRALTRRFRGLKKTLSRQHQSRIRSAVGIDTPLIFHVVKPVEHEYGGIRVKYGSVLSIDTDLIFHVVMLAGHVNPCLHF